MQDTAKPENIQHSSKEQGLNELRQRYEEVVGKPPPSRGPQSVDKAWLARKIEEAKAQHNDSPDKANSPRLGPMSEREAIEVVRLVKKHEDMFGSKPRGAKARELAWLYQKVGEAVPEVFTGREFEDVDAEVESLQARYEELYGLRPRGGFAKQASWLRQKIAEHAAQKANAAQQQTHNQNQVDITKLQDRYEELYGFRPPERGGFDKNVPWMKQKIEELESQQRIHKDLDPLRKRYEEVYGTSPRGPHKNNVTWLSQKIEEAAKAAATKDEAPEAKQTLAKLKQRYHELYGHSPGGIRANDAEWIEQKIKESEQGATELKQKLVKLKQRYEELYGHHPGGIRQTDPEWIEQKIKEAEQQAPELKQRLVKLQKRYEEIYGHAPGGIRHNDAEWIEQKIKEAEANPELVKLRLKYEEVTGTIPPSQKATILWLKQRIREVCQYQCDDCEEMFLEQKELRSHRKTCSQNQANKAASESSKTPKKDAGSKNTKASKAASESAKTTKKEAEASSQAAKESAKESSKGESAQGRDRIRDKPERTDRGWECWYCQEVFASRIFLREHRQGCEKKKSRIRPPSSSGRKRERDKEDRTSQGTWRCGCGEEFDRRGALREHRRDCAERDKEEKKDKKRKKDKGEKETKDKGENKDKKRKKDKDEKKTEGKDEKDKKSKKDNDEKETKDKDEKEEDTDGQSLLTFLGPKAKAAPSERKASSDSESSSDSSSEEDSSSNSSDSEAGSGRSSDTGEDAGATTTPTRASDHSGDGFGAGTHTVAVVDTGSSAGAAPGTGSAAAAQSPDQTSKGSLPPGWEEMLSEEYGIPFYWNESLGEALWERPT